MIKILKLSPIDIDGCSVGVCAEDGTPIMKPWRILVSSEHVGNALSGHLCDRAHAHARCEGARTSRTAIYPRRLCELIHKGLDAHERAVKRALPAPIIATSIAYVPPEIQHYPIPDNAGEARPPEIQHYPSPDNAGEARLSMTHHHSDKINKMPGDGGETASAVTGVTSGTQVTVKPVVGLSLIHI